MTSFDIPKKSRFKEYVSTFELDNLRHDQISKDNRCKAPNSQAYVALISLFPWSLAASLIGAILQPQSTERR